MLLLVTTFLSALHIVNVPFDNGANKRGSAYAPKLLSREIVKRRAVDSVFDVDGKQHVTEVLSEAYDAIADKLGDEPTLVLGGDHTISISSVTASNAYCQTRNLTMGVLWCDAHADFNTMYTSPTGNLHGVPVAVLCGHTLPSLMCEAHLSPSQFLYYGLRDMDSFEQDRFNTYNMSRAQTHEDVASWVAQFDRIHLSIDVDVLDPDVKVGCNTPVSDGKQLVDLQTIVHLLKTSEKLIAVDVVEFNPMQILHETDECLHELIDIVLEAF